MYLISEQLMRLTTAASAQGHEVEIISAEHTW